MKPMELRRGDTLSIGIAFKVDGVAQDMSTWSLEATLRQWQAAPLALTCTWLQQSQGTAEAKLAHTATANLPVGAHVFRLRATTPTGERFSGQPVTVTVVD